MAKRAAPEVNAGSTADIAFLLLIFFLITTTFEKDSGIARLLPAKRIDQPIVDIKQKNLFEVSINKNDELFVENELMEINELRQATINFLDNGGAVFGTYDYCNFCKGDRNSESSDNPKKAVVSIKSDRNTSYNKYIAVQNELIAAYHFLRDRESQNLYDWKFTDVKKSISDGNVSDVKKEKYKNIQDLIPINLIEAEVKR